MSSLLSQHWAGWCELSVSRFRRHGTAVQWGRAPLAGGLISSNEQVLALYLSDGVPRYAKTAQLAPRFFARRRGRRAGPRRERGTRAYITAGGAGDRLVMRHHRRRDLPLVPPVWDQLCTIFPA